MMVSGHTLIWLYFIWQDDGNSIKVGDTITIETAASSGVCGVTLDNDEYLLGGRFIMLSITIHKQSQVVLNFH